MNRNRTWLSVFAALVFTALNGCGDGDAPNVVSNPPIEASTDSDATPDAQPEADLPDNNVPDSDAAVPETGHDADACAAKLCEACANEGEMCGSMVCFTGKWNDASDGAITSSACGDLEAGPDADAAETDAESGNDADAEAGQDADAEAEAAIPEVCNGLDDNGNGLKDEGFACIGGTSGLCTTSCGTQGSITCAIPACTWSVCDPPAEICGNYKDDDCDGKVDCQDADCANDANCQCHPPTLGSDCGLPGEYSCSLTVRCNCNFVWDDSSLPHYSCIVTETCNGQDDNGNGQIDEIFPCIKNTSGQCNTTCGSIGSRACDSNCQQGACVPPAENCTNLLDDDCDGKIDCADPDCAQFLACKPELCDGADNNGNGVKDEGFECAYGATAPCQTSCGSQGHMSCSTATCTWGACVPGAEICGNGVDDDCNGKKDCADAACMALPACNVVVEICGNGVDDNANGLTDCADPACAGKTGCLEVCNGLDDNNDGQPDETFSCISGKTDSCVTSCLSTGSRVCDSVLCVWGACQPPAETCNNSTDDDCDGFIDCDDPDCSGLSYCGSEVCDGADNNGNGQVDETFQCKLGAKTSCATTCGSTGEKTCEGPSCLWGGCQVPVENCTNGVDDDCDEAPDCWDPDCAGATACQHDFGTCSAHTPTDQPYVCSTWAQDVMPDGMYLVKDGCANSLNDQWVVGGTYGEGRVRHLTGGNIWTNVTLPLTTKMAMGVTCQGATDTYVSAVEEYAAYKYNGVLLRWNGSALVRVAEAQTKDVEFGSVWASSATNVWIYGRTDYGLLDGAYIYTWNGNGMSRRKLPQLYAPMTFHAAKVWGSGPNDVYLAGTTYDPNDRNNASKYHAGLMHFDGKSWGKVTIPSEIRGLLNIHGTDSCDVMAVGDKVINSDSQGITLQRNGSTWTYNTYANVMQVRSVVKVAPHKFVLQGKQPDGAISHVWMGTDQGNFDVTWSNNFQYFVNGTAFWAGGATWKVPVTNVIMTAGDGTHGYGETTGQGTYAMAFRSTCQ